MTQTIFGGMILIIGILIGFLIAAMKFDKENKAMKKKYEDDILHERDFQKRMNAINSLREMKGEGWKDN